MSKTYQSISLFIAIFILAYTGSLYLQYALANTAAETSKDSSPALPGTNLGTNKQASNITRTNKSTALNVDKAENAPAPEPEQTLVQNGKQKSTKDKAFTAGDNNPGQARFSNNNAPSNAFQQQAEQADLKTGKSGSYRGSNIMPVISNSRGEVAPVSSSSNGVNPASTVTPGNSSTGGNKPGSNTRAESDSDPDTLSPPDNGTDTTTAPDRVIQVQESHDFSKMCTADCPCKLPYYISESEIKSYLTNFGCRYRKACVKKNDGTPDFDCYWDHY